MTSLRYCHSIDRIRCWNNPVKHLDLLPWCLHSQFIEPDQSSNVIWTDAEAGMISVVCPAGEEPHVTVSPDYLCPTPPQLTPPARLRSVPGGAGAGGPADQPPPPRPEALTEVHHWTRPGDEGATVKILLHRPRPTNYYWATTGLPLALPCAESSHSSLLSVSWTNSQNWDNFLGKSQLLAGLQSGLLPNTNFSESTQYSQQPVSEMKWSLQRQARSDRQQHWVLITSQVSPALPNTTQQTPLTLISPPSSPVHDVTGAGWVDQCPQVELLCRIRCGLW